MALDALSLSSSDLLNLFIYDTISATPYTSLDSSILMETSHPCFGGGDGGVAPCTSPSINNMNNWQHCPAGGGTTKTQARKDNLALGQQGRKKRRRRPRVCKNKEEAETQRMTHIAVERNRRKQMNEHLAVLKSLMPESYVQRGDQASVVGGAIEFVKELEHLLQSLEAQRSEQRMIMEEETMSQSSPDDTKFRRPPFSQFFCYPQYTWSQLPNNNNLQSKYSAASSSSSTGSININGNASASGGTMAAVADIEVTLIETHANMRILSRKSPRQLSRLVAGFHTLHLSILHLNVTSLHPLVLYSISAKVEEGCQLTTVDDIAGAVHHMLRIIEEGEGERGGGGEGSLC